MPSAPCTIHIQDSLPLSSCKMSDIGNKAPDSGVQCHMFWTADIEWLVCPLSLSVSVCVCVSVSLYPPLFFVCFHK